MKLTKSNLLVFADEYASNKEKSFKEYNEICLQKKNYLTKEQLHSLIELRKMICRLYTEFED